jgi:hypothetical protein
VWFDSNEVDGQWFVRVSLLDVPNVRHFVALVLYGVFDIDVCEGMDVFKHNSETSVLSGFICMEFSIPIR